jgi:hypothetical protein
MVVTKRIVALMTIWLLVLIVTFKDLLTGYPFNFKISLRYVDDLILISIFYFGILKFFSCGKINKHVVKFVLLFSVLCVYVVLHHLLIGSSFVRNNYIFVFRDNFWYFFVFVFLWSNHNYIKRRDIEKVIYFFLYTQLTFFLIAQLFHIVTRGEILLEDDVNGTLGANTSHVISYLLVLFIPFCLKKRNWILLIGISLIIITASARSMYFFFVLSWLFQYLRKVEIYRLVRFAIVFLFLSYPIYFYFSNFTGFTLNPRILYNIQNVKLEEGSGAARISFVLYSYSKVADSRDYLLFGFGPASYSSRSAKVMEGAKYKEYLKDFPFPNEFISGGSTLNPWIVELGIFGTLILLAVLGLVYSSCPRDRLVQISFFTVILGLIAQKLLEEYSISFFLWFMLYYYQSNDTGILKDNSNE